MPQPSKQAVDGDDGYIRRKRCCYCSQSKREENLQAGKSSQAQGAQWGSGEGETGMG